MKKGGRLAKVTGCEECAGRETPVNCAEFANSAAHGGN